MVELSTSRLSIKADAIVSLDHGSGGLASQNLISAYSSST